MFSISKFPQKYLLSTRCVPGTVLGPGDAGMDKTDVVSDSPMTRLLTKQAAAPPANMIECSHCAQLFRCFSGVLHCAGTREGCEDCFPCLFELFAIEIHDSLYVLEVLDHFPWLLKVSIYHLSHCRPSQFNY